MESPCFSRGRELLRSYREGGQKRRCSPCFCSKCFYPYHDPSLPGKHTLSFRKLHSQGEPPSKKNGSHDDLRDDRRQLHSCMPDCSPRTHRLYPLCTGMDCCHHRHDPQGLLDQLPQMVFLCDLYWNGLAVCTGFCSDLPQSARAGFGWLLAGGIIYTIGGVIYALKLPIFNAKHNLAPTKYFMSL